MTLDEILEAKEGEEFEFKEAKYSFEYDKLVKYACAISNRGGGYIVFGVTDKRPRKVVGSRAFEQPERTRRGLMDKLMTCIDFMVFNDQSPDRVLVFKVSGRPIGVPVMADGIAWWRDGDSLVPMPAEEMRLIFNEASRDFSAEICDGACLSDISEEAVIDFRERWIAKSKREDLRNYSLEQILRDCEALTSNGLTNAAVILFGRSEAVGRLLPQSEIIYEYRLSEEAGPADSRVEFRKGFFLGYEELWNQIAQRNTVQHYRDKFFIPDIPTFDEGIVRELVLNAVSHRDYQLAPPVFVRQFAQRIEIDNPGGFPPDVNIENIIDRQSPRNRRIADIFSKCGLVERSGQGMNLIYNQSILQGKALPDFSGTDRLHVKVTHSGIVEDPALVAMMAKIGRETLRGFSTRDLLVVHNIRKKMPIPDSMHKHLEKLLELGVVERISHGKYILGKRYYQQIGHGGAYTRQKGLKTDAVKALILQHIQENNAIGSPYSDFSEAFPAMARSSLQKILRDMRDEQKIMVIGVKRGARWYLYDETRLFAYKKNEEAKASNRSFGKSENNIENGSDN